MRRRGFVMLVELFQWLADPEVLQELLTLAAFFAHDKIHTPEHLQCAERHVLRVPDRRCDKVEDPRHLGSLSRLPPFQCHEQERSHRHGDEQSDEPEKIPEHQQGENENYGMEANLRPDDFWRKHRCFEQLL